MKKDQEIKTLQNGGKQELQCCTDREMELKKKEEKKKVFMEDGQKQRVSVVRRTETGSFCGKTDRNRELIRESEEEPNCFYREYT